jgi:hypothetical protein
MARASKPTARPSRRSAPVQAPAPLATTDTARTSVSLTPMAPRPAVDVALAAHKAADRLDEQAYKRVATAAEALAYILECVDECNEPLAMAMTYLDTGEEFSIASAQDNLRTLAFQLSAIRSMVVQATGDMAGPDRRMANAFEAMGALTSLVSRGGR